MGRPDPSLAKTWSMGTLANALTGTDRGNQIDMVLKRHANRKALGHLIKGSGNGTTGAMDGVDRWTSTGSFPTGTAGVWCVYQQPGSGAQDLYAPYNLGENDYYIGHSPGGNYTGGSSSARPTAFDEAILWNNSWFGRGGGGSNPQFVLNWWCSSDLTCYRESYWLNSIAFGDLDMSAIDDPSDGWTVPGGGTPWAVPNYGMADKHANDVNTTNNTIGYLPNYVWNPFTGQGIFNTWGPHGAMHMLATCEASGQGSLVATASGAMLAKNKISNTYRTPFQPGLYVIYTAADGGWHGRIFDMWWGAENGNTGAIYASGSTLPLDGSKQAVVIGDKILPWNGTAFRIT